MQNYPVDKRLLALFALLVVSSYGLLFLGAAAVDSLIREDGVIESVGTVGFLVAAIGFLLSWRRLRQRGESLTWFKQLAFVGLGLLLVFVAGEEISWGQRIFGFGTPEGLREINTQDEFNFHNLEVIQGSSLLNTDRLFTLFVLGFVVVVPVTAVIHPASGNWLNQLLPVVPWLLGLLFLLNYGVANAFRPLFADSLWYQSSYPLKHSVVELKEAVYGVLFALVGVYVFRLSGRANGGTK